jgi:hypothetical protein
MWKLRCDLRLTGIVGHLVLWLIVGVLTCGIAFFLFPYSFGATVINATRIEDEHGRVIGRLRCTQGVAGHLVHAFVWWLLTIVTLGMAGLFYSYRVASDLLGATVVDSVRG